MRLNKVYRLLLVTGMAVGAASVAQASGFQLFEQSGAGTGDYHAGGAAEANDASTEWYNPAGMTRIKHQQLSVGGVVINTNIPFRGTVEDNSVNPGSPQYVSTQGGGFNFVPNLHYVAPISNNWAFGFGVNVPFGLKTDYPSDTYLRYVGTETSVQAIDLTPSLAVRFSHGVSVGAGADIVYTKGIFDQYAGLGAGGVNDTSSDNTGHDWAYGFHAGILYELNNATRFGIAYHSKIVNHMKGTSKFSGPLANSGNGGVEENSNLRANFALPPSTEFSVFHTINKKWDIMASAQYTQWDVFKNLVLQNVAALSSSDIDVVVHEGYKNTWNFAAGAHYHISSKWTWKFGGGYDMTPSNNQDRNIQLPDSNRIAASTGLAYQAMNNLRVDLGYTHLFMKNAHINTTQPVDIAQSTTIGTVKGSADIIGLELTWTIV